jgi:molecular chaperone DnaK
LLGRKYDDADVKIAVNHLPYEITRAGSGDIQVWMDKQAYSPQEITAMILAKLKKNTEIYLNETVKSVVISVPAVFNTFQRKALIDSCKIAGLEIARMINEPAAFSLAHHFGSKIDKTVMIINIGGGFIGTTVLSIGAGVWELRSTSGDNCLGGEEFDQRVTVHLIDEFKKQQNTDLSNDRQAICRLKEAAEKARIELSAVMETEINLPYIYADANGPKNLIMTMTRPTLEQLTNDLIEKTIKPVKQALDDDHKKPYQIDEVFLVGGMTRMPKFQEIVKKMFGQEARKGFNPNEMIASGTAIYAGVLGGSIKDVLLLDVMPITLSIETVGGVATCLVNRNETIPTYKTKTFTTTVDNQTQVDIHILEGEGPMATDVKSLGHFMLEGIPSALKGIPQIEVAFDIDANGILNVSALDKATGRSQKVIAANSGLSVKEIEQSKTRVEAMTSHF